MDRPCDAARADTSGTRWMRPFPLKNETVAVEIVSPHFVDPENLRVRA